MTDPDDDLLEAHFAALRARPATPSGALMTRLLADARAELPAAVGPVSALGGWAGVGGLLAAAVTGLMVGVADPAAVDLFDWTGTDTATVGAGYGWTDPLEAGDG